MQDRNTTLGLGPCINLRKYQARQLREIGGGHRMAGIDICGKALMDMKPAKPP
ncbi:MAG: hypothetical protein NZM43_05605 [Saprospiraceae bacterium]|nr:hypothetical protein [Saprospiraceae bacterium]MDW8483784.1 hypothetical protein [Saprospiraceae bacterium]